MTNMVTQRMFTVGEVDVTLYKRTDSEAYLAGAQKLLNMEVGTTGLCKKRKGTKFLLNVAAQFDLNSQLYEYVDQNHNYWIIMSAASAAGWWAYLISSVDGSLSAAVNIPGTPYASSDLLDIDYTLDNDSLVLSHPNYPPARIYISTYPNTFTYQVLQIAPYYPVFDFNVINYNSYAVSFTNSGSTFSMTMTGADAGNFTNAWINGQIVALGANPTQPIGYGIITSVTPSAGSVTFTGNVVIAFAASASMPTVGSQYSIRQPAWSNALGWPAVVTFYQNRLWFANTMNLPGTIFGSKLNQPVSFDVGVGGDADAIIYSIGESNSGQILWMNGGKQLEIYSENFEFAAPQNDAIGLTPSTFAIRQQSAYGSSGRTKPITYINDSYYISKNNNAIINFHFNGIGLTYQSSNVSMASQHLVKSPYNRAILRADSVSQDNFIYFLNGDSTLTAFQFAAEFKLAALTPVDFNTNPDNGILVLATCNVNNMVYFLKVYGGVIAIEQFDDSVRIDSWFPATMNSAGVVTALSVPLTNINNYFAQVNYIDNNGNLNDLGVSQVVAGALTADNPNGYSGTVQVGFLYDVLVRPMYITPGNSKYKSASSATYDKKILSRIYVDYVNSLDFFVNGTLINYQSYLNIQNNTGLVPLTGTAITSIQAGYSRFSTFDITQSSPFDLQITGISYQIKSDII